MLQKTTPTIVNGYNRKPSTHFLVHVFGSILARAASVFHINPQLGAISSSRFSPTTGCSSIGRSHLYVRKNSHAASIANKVSNSSAERRAPSDLPHILQYSFCLSTISWPPLGYQSQQIAVLKACRWRIIIDELGRNETNEVDVCLSLCNIPQ